MAIIIEPYVGIKYNDGMINFNMSPEEIRKITGVKIEEIQIVTREEMWEDHSEMILVYINNKLMDINFSSNIRLFLYNRELHITKNVIEVLKNYDEEIIGKSGYSNFYKLGISVGWNEKIKECGMNFITAFCKDRLEFYKNYM